MFKFKSLCRALGGALLTVGCTAALAVPVAYDEATMGDLATGLTTELTLDIGTNTIRGQMHSFATPTGNADNDLDPVTLLLPANMLVSSMHVDLHFVDTTGNTGALTWEWLVITNTPEAYTAARTCFAVVVPTDFCSNPAPTGGDLLGGIPASAPQYLVVQGSVTGAIDWSIAYGGTVDYTLTVDVVAVPEPSTALLGVLGGVVLLGHTRQRIRGRQGSRAQIC